MRLLTSRALSIKAIHQGLMDSARHVTGCRFIQETRVGNAFDDVASTIH
jgi:hypothetical protein